MWLLVDFINADNLMDVCFQSLFSNYSLGSSFMHHLFFNFHNSLLSIRNLTSFHLLSIRTSQIITMAVSKQCWLEINNSFCFWSILFIKWMTIWVVVIKNLTYIYREQGKKERKTHTQTINKLLTSCSFSSCY